MAENPIELMIAASTAATKLATDTMRLAASAAMVGVTRPDELASQLSGQVADLAGTVAGLATAFTGLAGTTAQPLQDFVVRQRELADTVASLAEAQAHLADIVAGLADRQAEVVAALETVTAPLFQFMGTEPTPPRRPARKAAPRPKKA
ncbi:hypothetical protein GCM10028801_33960 [Nocardioides maradonensis]